MSRDRYRSFADAAEGHQRMVPVERVTRPTYESPEEKAQWESATRATPRRKGEGMFEWFERICAAAAETSPGVHEHERQLPLCDRDPGEEG